MKTVILTVRVTAVVDDDAPTDDLCLDLPDEGVEITDLTGESRGHVEEYETLAVTSRGSYECD